MPFEKGHPPYGAAARKVASEAIVEAPPVEPITIPTSRFLLADIPARGLWLMKRLNEKWPHISEATFAGRVRAWIGSNSHYFVKSAHGVGLATVRRTELDTLPVVDEVFLFLEEGIKNREAFAIYRDTARWAKSIGADKYFVDICSDATSYEIVRTLGATEDIHVFLKL